MSTTAIASYPRSVHNPNCNSDSCRARWSCTSDWAAARLNDIIWGLLKSPELDIDAIVPVRDHQEPAGQHEDQRRPFDKKNGRLAVRIGKRPSARGSRFRCLGYHSRENCQPLARRHNLDAAYGEPASAKSKLPNISVIQRSAIKARVSRIDVPDDNQKKPMTTRS